MIDKELYLGKLAYGAYREQVMLEEEVLNPLKWRYLPRGKKISWDVAAKKVIGAYLAKQANRIDK